MAISFLTVSLSAYVAGPVLGAPPSRQLAATPTLSAKTARPAKPISPLAKPEKPLVIGIPKRVRWTTSRVLGSPEPPYPYRFQRTFPKLKFSKPVYMIPEPGTDRIFVLDHPDGVIFAMKDDPSTKESVEIFRVPVEKGQVAEGYSQIFHPDYVHNRQVFVFANVKNKDDKKTKDFKKNEHNEILRFRVDSAPPHKIIPSSRQKIIEWASAGHDGGDMAFGSDGCLYITTGDGTTGSDPDITGQDLSDLRSAVLRIDVDHPEGGKPYRVPKDNPFLNVPHARPEIWAFGLRNPWRMSFDPPTGNFWVGDVGQDLWEMILLVRRGGNYGWSVMEGTHPFFPDRKIGPAPISPPIVEHHHSEARSITGGYVYHGKRLPELADHYLYCCYQTGTVWGFRYEKGRVIDHRVLADSTYNCAGWGRDHANELYLIAYSGELLQLEPNPLAKEGAAKFPERLSQTGLFESVPDQRPAPGVIPYSVNAPVWHDGATMTRLLAVPNNDTIDQTHARGWEFADGAVLVQTLSLEMEKGKPQSKKKIETRLMTRQGGEWFGYSYEWDDAQTDARLVPKEGRERTFQIRDGHAPHGVRQRTWRIPSRSDCMVCHSRAANFVLGLNTLEMNRVHQYGSIAANQLTTLSAAAYFSKPLGDAPEKGQKLVNPYDKTADLDARVRSYLHVNCSQCHVADGGGNARMELEFTTSRDKMNVIGVAPLQGKFEIPDAELVAAGDPFRSVMLYRISKLGGGRMPQVGSGVVDHVAVDMLYRWIQSLPPATSNGPAGTRLAQLRKKDEGLLASLQAPGSPQSEHDEKVGHLLSTTSGSMRLARAVDENRLHPAMQTKAIETASAHPNPVVRDLFERYVPEEKRIHRLGSSISPSALLGVPGLAARGEDLFFKSSAVNCQTCHQINGKGREIGPDLSHVGKKYNRAQILENILEPSKTMEDRYVPYVVQTVQGKTYTGLIVRRTSEAMLIKDAQANVVQIPIAELDSFEPQKKSLMPDSLLRDFTAQQAADLLAFLESLK